MFGVFCILLCLDIKYTWIFKYYFRYLTNITYNYISLVSFTPGAKQQGLAQ